MFKFPARSINRYDTGVLVPVVNVSPGEWDCSTPILAVGVMLSVAVGGVHLTTVFCVPAGTCCVTSDGQPFMTGITLSTDG